MLPCLKTYLEVAEAVRVRGLPALQEPHILALMSKANAATRNAINGKVATILREKQKLEVFRRILDDVRDLDALAMVAVRLNELTKMIEAGERLDGPKLVHVLRQWEGIINAIVVKHRNV